MNCERMKDLVTLYVYGELDPSTEESVEQHAAECKGCAALLDTEREFHATLDLGVLAPPPAMLAGCRRELMQAVKEERAAQGRSWTVTVRSWFEAPWLKPVMALALVTAGFAAGRLIPLPGNSPVATRVRFLEADGAGRVNLVLEETRERKLSGSLGDEPIRNLVLAAAQDPADPGLRVESMELLRRESSASEVRRALMAALVSDSNPGVRMKAIEGLRGHAADPEVQRALAQVLMRDDNPGLRVQAIDLLVPHPRKDMVGVLQDVMRREDNDYVRLRTQRVLSQMNASVDPF